MRIRLQIIENNIGNNYTLLYIGNTAQCWNRFLIDIQLGLTNTIIPSHVRHYKNKIRPGKKPEQITKNFAIGREKFNSNEECEDMQQ